MFDINTLAAWGEFIGGITVVVSLIYLAGQIRQNSRLLQVSATVALGESDIALYRLAVDDPQLSINIEQGLSNLDALSDLDRNRFENFLSMLTAVFQRSYFVAQDGALKQTLWQAEQRGNMDVLRQPGPQQWWRDNRYRYSEEFADYVDDLIREGEGE